MCISVASTPAAKMAAQNGVRHRHRCLVALAAAARSIAACVLVVQRRKCPARCCAPLAALGAIPWGRLHQHEMIKMVCPQQWCAPRSLFWCPCLFPPRLPPVVYTASTVYRASLDRTHHQTECGFHHRPQTSCHQSLQQYMCVKIRANNDSVPKPPHCSSRRPASARTLCGVGGVHPASPGPPLGDSTTWHMPPRTRIG